MKSLKKIFAAALAALTAVLLLTACACSAKNHMPEEAPEDFSFALTWNAYGVSSYDSATGRLVKTTDVFERDPEDYVCTLWLSEEQTEEIYGVLRQLNPENYPEKYDPNPGTESDPSMTIILTVRYGGTQRTTECRNIALSYESKNAKGRKFLTACRKIIDLIYSTDEWKALPDYEMLYD